MVYNKVLNEVGLKWQDVWCGQYAIECGQEGESSNVAKVFRKASGEGEV